MPNEFYREKGRGAFRLTRHWVPDPEWPIVLHGGGGGSNAGRPGPSTAGRVVNGWSRRSLQNLAWTLAVLDWARLGPRPAMVTLTYPRDWRAAVPDGRALKAQLKRFERRWRRRWGVQPVGVWVLEFQGRGAPHVHLYVGLPDAVTAEDYSGLVARRQQRGHLEKKLGMYGGRRRTPIVRGEFGEWARAAWFEAVGSGEPSHARRGVDVTPCFWGSALLASERGEVNWSTIARYLSDESAKFAQKKAPDDWPRVGRSWGLWGGVGRSTEVEKIAKAEFDEERRPVRAMQRKRVEKERAARHLPPVKVRGARGADGGRCFLAEEQAERLHEWAATESRRKASERQDQGSEDESRRCDEEAEEAPQGRRERRRSNTGNLERDGVHGLGA